MKEFKKRYFIVISLLFLTALPVLIFQNMNKNISPSVDVSKIPARIGKWEARDIPLEKNVFNILRTPSVLVREYTDPQGKSVYLTVVYYRRNRVEFHSPERCSVGHGSYIDETGRETIENGAVPVTANKFIVKGETGREANIYYFKSGDFITASYLSLKWHMALNKLKGLPNSGALVKFSAAIGQDMSVDETIRVMKAFIKEAAPYLSRYLI